jgi:cell division protein ZapA (FtsZ GTPase activity inhibitor)
LQNATASRDDIKIAVLSALNIAGELFEAKAKYEAELKKVQECQEKIKSLSDKIDRSADK